MNDYQRSVKALDAAAAEWRQAQAAERAAHARLVTAVVEADAHLSEYTMATEVGVTRLTIRKWLGK